MSENEDIKIKRTIASIRIGKEGFNLIRNLVRMQSPLSVPDRMDLIYRLSGAMRDLPEPSNNFTLLLTVKRLNEVLDAIDAVFNSAFTGPIRRYLKELEQLL